MKAKPKLQGLNLLFNVWFKKHIFQLEFFVQKIHFNYSASFLSIGGHFCEGIMDQRNKENVVF